MSQTARLIFTLLKPLESFISREVIKINTKLIYSRKGDLKYWLQDSPKKTDADGNPIELKTLGTHYKDWKASKQ